MTESTDSQRRNGVNEDETERLGWPGRKSLSARPPRAGARVSTPPTETNTPGIEVERVRLRGRRTHSAALRAARTAIDQPGRLFSVSPPFAPLLRLWMR